MKKYSVRPAVPTDIEAVHALVASQTLFDYGSAISIEDLRRVWQGLNLEKDTCTAFEDGKLVGYGELLDNDSPFVYLAERNNSDLAFQLLTILEDKAVKRKKDKLELFTRISEKNNTLLQLFASNGYRSNLSFLIMELVMEDAPPAPQLPEGISVRAFIKGQDEQATYQADEEAAEDKGYHTPLSYDDWVKRMRMDRETFDPTLWFLACDESEIAGVALNLFNKETETGWVDHLSVRRAWRKRGMGRALLLQSFGEFYRRGVKRIKLSVDSKSLTHAPRLYESVGMKTIQQYHIYTKEV